MSSVGSCQTYLGFVLISTDEGQDFGRGDYIVVNKTDPPPTPPHEDAPPEEVLKYQRDNSWIGRIQQAKAESASEVWIRVFWFYWPEELPMGIQQYHGRSELILSNYTDIIDARAISGRAEISHWDEYKDADDDLDLTALYWRQTYDLNKVGRMRKGGLSALRKHCTCRQEYNPDSTMFRCSRTTTCGSWNHLECLEKHLRTDLTARLKKETFRDYLDKRAATYAKEQQEKKRTLGSTIAVGIASVAYRAINAVQRTESAEPELDEDDDTSFDAERALLTPSKKQQRRKKTANGVENATEAMPEQNLKIHISTADSGSGHRDGSVVAEITLLRPVTGEENVNKWTIKLDCLRCFQPLD